MFLAESGEDEGLGKGLGSGGAGKLEATTEGKCYQKSCAEQDHRVLILNGPCGCMLRLGCSSKGEEAFRRQWRTSS